ncbi:MAG TPA: AMP-binding protein [Patescibacteria group bacterium]|nr:AMP-binding protein [Patescibacteria group bacterium]
MMTQNWEWIGDQSGQRARMTPDREAIYDLDYNIRYTYKDLDDRANKLANYMAEKLDVKKGDRVGFVARNIIEMFDGIFACGKLGAIFVPYNLRLSADELKLLFDNEEPKVLFYEDVFSSNVEKVKKNSSTLKNYVLISKTDSRCDDIKYREIMAYSNTAPRRCEDLTLEEPYLLIHTGGTTGLPKAAMISHRAVLFNTLNNIIDWGFTQDDSAHIILPLFHTGGWNILTLALLRVGGHILINKSLEPKLALKVIHDYKPTCVFGAATIFRMLYEQPEFETTDWSSVKWVMSGAAPTPIQVMEKFWEKGIKICSGYGLTEGGPMNLGTPVHLMTLEQLKEKYMAVGIPFHFTVAKIVKDNGSEALVDEPGELIFSGPQVFSGYWKNEEETKKVFRDGWVYTGDIAKKDKDGFYHIVGRKKNMYISGGENVFPPEIERVLYDMDEVHECCVIGVPDEKWGEVGKAVIALKPGKQAVKEQVIAFLNARLARYKIPRYVTFVPEVPKNTVGKIVAQDVVKLYGKPED